jgi:pyrroline-5-carboxylate reductase
VAREDVLAADPDPERRAVFERKLKIATTADNRAVARHAETLLLAVKPQVLDGVCRSFAGDLTEPTLVLSIAAGVRLDRLQGLLGDSRPIIRVMPNILHTVRAGVAALCANAPVSEEQLKAAVALFRSIGVAEVVEEKLMDAVTGLSGSGPAFVFVFIEALADGAVAAGLPRSLALPFAAQTVLGSARWVLDPDAPHPAALRDLVTSPGGTTIAGLRAAEAGGLRSAAMEAVIAAARRSEELGRPKEGG